MKIKVRIEIEDEEHNTVSLGEHQTEYNSDNKDCYDDMLLAIGYAIPKHEMIQFDVIELYRKGEMVAHAEP